MMEKVKNTASVEQLFADWQETVIWSCLAGTMGDLYADDLEHPRCAMAILGDFCYLAGEPKEALAAFKPDWHGAPEQSMGENDREGMGAKGKKSYPLCTQKGAGSF